MRFHSTILWLLTCPRSIKHMVLLLFSVVYCGLQGEYCKYIVLYIARACLYVLFEYMHVCDREMHNTHTKKQVAWSQEMRDKMKKGARKTAEEPIGIYISIPGDYYLGE